MSRPLAAASFVLLAALSAAAQRQPTHENVAYGPHARNVLDVWLADGDGPHALLVHIHGGGWCIGDKGDDRTFCEPFLAQGISCASINYRRTDTDPLPAPVHDAARAIQFLRSKAKEWKLDPARFAATGGSAGACTAMWLLLHDDLADPSASDPVARESTKLCAVAARSGQTSIDPKVIEAWVGPRILDHRMIWRAVGEPDRATALANYVRHRATYAEFSPINHLGAGDGPLFLSYPADTTLPAKDAGHGIHHAQLGVELEQRAKALGVECHLAIAGQQAPAPHATATAFLIAKLAQDPKPKPAAADEELVARAKAIHARVLTLDTHKDIDSKLAPASLPDDPATREEFRRRYDPTVRGSAQVDFPKMREGNYDCAFFIVYVGQGPLTAAGYARALAEANAKFDAIHRMARLHGDTIGLATTPDDVERLHREGKLIACIGIENGYPMGEDLALVEKFQARGARYMGIAHNRHSQLGDSHTPAEPLHGGLSELGKKAIAEMNRVGIMVDISHGSRATMLQAVELSRAPVIASHSGCRAVSDHARNLDDELLKALAKKGGVVQCVALGDFVKVDAERSKAVTALRAELGLEGRRTRQRDPDAPPDPSLDERLARFAERMKAIDAQFPLANVRDFVDHIDHAVKVAGIDHVGIGSDFDGGGGIVGWNNASETANVTIELVRRGYTEQQIGKIWSGNLLRVWRAVEQVAKQSR